MGKTILFDLDGTLTDSGEGIMNCAALALAHFGIPVPEREALRVFVGPPLDKTFREFGVPADKTNEAIAVYRSRYVPIGKWENHPYPGVEEMLQKQGVEAYGNVGDIFDPNLHNAVMHDEDPEKPEGYISDVFMKGYKKGDRVLRYAMVKTLN